MATNGYQYAGHKFHDKFHRDHREFDKGNLQVRNSVVFSIVRRYI